MLLDVDLRKRPADAGHQNTAPRVRCVLAGGSIGASLPEIRSPCGITRAGLTHVAALAPHARWMRVDLTMNELDEEDHALVVDAPWRWMEDLNLDRGYHHLNWPQFGLIGS